MKAQGSIILQAGNLSSVLAESIPGCRSNKRYKPYPVTIEYDAAAGCLKLSEARFALTASELPAVGNWPAQVQIDGRKLQKVCMTFPAGTSVELLVTDRELVLLAGKSQLLFPRFDVGGRGGIRQRAVPLPPGYEGKVIRPPERTGNKVELADTWLFSARVPMPQHRTPIKKT